MAAIYLSNRPNFTNPNFNQTINHRSAAVIVTFRRKKRHFVVARSNKSKMPYIRLGSQRPLLVAARYSQSGSRSGG